MEKIPLTVDEFVAGLRRELKLGQLDWHVIPDSIGYYLGIKDSFLIRKASLEAVKRLLIDGEVIVSRWRLGERHTEQWNITPEEVVTILDRNWDNYTKPAGKGENEVRFFDREMLKEMQERNHVDPENIRIIRDCSSIIV